MSESGSKMTRRRFLRWLGLTAGSIGVMGFGGWKYVWDIEPWWLVLEQVMVPIAGLPPALEGLTLAQLSDLHWSPVIKEGHIAKAVDMALTAQPDLIVLTGDYVTHRAHYINDCARELARLAAPLGVYAILGNHDHWTDAQIVQKGLEAVGLPVLLNVNVRIPVGNADLWLAGVDDVWEQRADLDRALAGILPGATTVLLAHEPDYADQVAGRADQVANCRVALQLSGHSHGGQVRPPLLEPPILPRWGRKYPCGLRRVGDLWLYTNRGVGLIEPAVRFNCRPEVTVIRLVRG
jgi:predicted MPP superfamily phosphohydrolase